MDQVIEFATNNPLLVGGFVVVLGLLIWTEVMSRLRGVKELSPALGRIVDKRPECGGHRRLTGR